MFLEKLLGSKNAKLRFWRFGTRLSKILYFQKTKSSLVQEVRTRIWERTEYFNIPALPAVV